MNTIQVHFQNSNQLMRHFHYDHLSLLDIPILFISLNIEQGINRLTFVDDSSSPPLKTKLK
jgi:hypothetical protein